LRQGVANHPATQRVERKNDTRSFQRGGSAAFSRTQFDWSVCGERNISYVWYGLLGTAAALAFHGLFASEAGRSARRF
jgi:hypothetical protein